MPAPEAPEATYSSEQGGELVLRCVLTPRTRTEYARLSDPAQARPGASGEDVWHRRVEFLFERLAVRWTINGVPTRGPKPLLTRWRAAGPEERAWVRDALRQHCAEWFPDVDAP